MKKRTLTFMACICMAAFGANGFAQDSKDIAKDNNKVKFNDTKYEDDAKFAVEAADIGNFEVLASQLAKTNASSAEVKKLAEMIAADHSKANAELKNTAGKKKISLPVGLSEKHQGKYNDLAKLKGHEFDKAYTEAMVKGHKDAIDKFEKQSEKGNDADLRTWAAAKLPVLRQHLTMAENAVQDVKKYD